MLQCHKNLWHGRKDNALHGDIKRGTDIERERPKVMKRGGRKRKVRGASKKLLFDVFLALAVS